MQANRDPATDESFGEYLERYEDSSAQGLDWMHLEGLAETAIVDRATLPPDELAQIAADHRHLADSATFSDPSLVEFRLAHRWAAQLLCDEELAERFINLLPVYLVDALNAQVAARRRPYPLRVEWCRRFVCDNCGQEAGPAKITFGDVASRLMDAAPGPEIPTAMPSWCASCITALAGEVAV